jgi:exopolyphosphatase / guanosine-5'-triphosphate,3'-diphosphate pyrophosphatase
MADEPMQKVVPRWEWRTFGKNLTVPDDASGLLVSTEVKESDELYALSPASEASVKLRDDLVDVKLLQRVDGDGLEQWRPVLKAAPPLSVGDARRVLEALGLPVPHPFDRESYGPEQFRALLRSAGVELVCVHKTRRRYKGGGCLVELTTIRVGDDLADTIAVESEDPASVVAMVTRLGFPLRPNVSVPRGLKRIVRLAGRYGVIDVGTNSVKFHLAERTAEGEWRTLVDRSEITRLGEGLDGTGELQREPMRRTLEAIGGMADEMRAAGAAEVAAVGTAGLRIASNSDAFVHEVQDKTGVGIEVISGEEESRLAYLAVKAGLGLSAGTIVVFDTGGGSSQYTFGAGDSVEERFSVDVGAVRFMERFGLDGPVSEDVLADAKAAMGSDLVRLDGRPRPDALVALGGVVTNLAAVKHALASYDPDVVQGTVLDTGEVDRQIELYRTRTADERREVVGLQPKRAEVVLAGACIVRVTMEKLRRESLVVSDRGLRHGLLIERFAS